MLKEPRPLPRVFAGAILLAALISSCQPPQTEDPAQNDTSFVNLASELPRLPAVVSLLDREALLLAVIHAASAHALGRDDTGGQRALEGKLFEFRIRFGCSPDDTNEQALGWRFDEDKRILRLRVRPEASLKDPLVRTLGGTAFEAVEGFWIRRPWLLTASCPPDRTTAPTAQPQMQPKAGTAEPAVVPAPPPRPRVGIAQFFTGQDSRTQRRRQRPYEATASLAEDESPSPQGYDLVLSGRLRRLPDGRVIACALEEPSSPPACIISAEFGRVQIERPDTHKVLAQWGGS